ncbi:MAG: cell wall hydrolase [Novosphingobium sp.]|nr:cell wall hydrolase [Novosphingobium sp.]
MRRSGARSLRSQGRRRKAPKQMLVLAGAVALPAFAAPEQWDAFAIGNAGQAEVQIEPMPFEKGGSSFPGSAFYYISVDEPEGAPQLGEGIHSDADIAPAPSAPFSGPSAQSMRIDNSGIDRTRALQCLTAAIYYEARSEPDSGQRAVAQVVLNRVAHPAYPNTVCGVVYQGSERRTGCQFSFTCDGSLARKPNPMFWLRAEDVARAALGGYVHAPAGLATHYHTIQVNPYWAPKLHYLGTIGLHRFYSFGGVAGRPATFRFAYAGGEPAARPHDRNRAADYADAALVDPLRVQVAFDGELRAQVSPGLEQQAQLAPPSASSTARPAAAPAYSEQVRERGGDSIYRAKSLPDASGIRPEYQNSGRWIAKPGA